MAVSGHALSDGLDLISEAKLKESVSFVIHDNLGLGKLQARLVDAVLETTWSRNNDIWIEQESFELIFHVVATDDETVS